MADAPKPPELRATDGKGHVRPADDRHLTETAKRKRDRYVEKVNAHRADQGKGRDAGEDTFGETIQAAVDRAQSKHQPPQLVVNMNDGGAGE
jgi:hypothetical protein